MRRSSSEWRREADHIINPNPDDPGHALKAMNAESNRMLRKWSAAEAEALDQIVDAEPSPPADMPEIEDEASPDAE